MNYCEIPLFEFSKDRDIPFAIYIRLSDEKFLKVANRSQDLSLDQLSSYRSKGISGLYLSREDFAAFSGIQLPLAAPPFSEQEQASFADLKRESEAAMDLIFNNDLNEMTYEISRTVVRDMLGFAAGTRDVLQILEALRAPATGPALFRHSVATSMYSVMIALRLGWVSTAKLYLVGLGGLLHDLGAKDIDAALLGKGRDELSASELLAWEKHPRLGASMLDKVGGIPSEVFLVILQHHEPAKLQTHPMAKIVSLADRFSDLALDENAGLTPLELIERLRFSRHYGSAELDALSDLFQGEVFNG